MSTLREIRIALRSIRAKPAFALGALATIALAVGATTAIFSVVYAVLLRQLPYDHADRVFWVWGDQQGRDRTPLNVPDFIDYRARAHALEGLAGYFSYGAALSDEAAGERLYGLRATGNFFEVLGARPTLGRLLRPADEHDSNDHVVVLTAPLWQRRFGANPNVIGSSIRLNGEPFTVVGIIEPGFVTPIRDVEFVVPFSPDRDARRGSRNSVSFIHGVARVRQEISPAQADAELDTIARTLQEQFPIENARKRGINMIAAVEGVAGSFTAALMTIFAAVGAVLLMACANLANLMLSRAAGKRKEIAVQLALGASRWAVARECLVEALLIGVCGGAAGVMVAYWGMQALVTLAPGQLPRLSDVALNPPVLAFSLLVSIVAGALFGCVPAVANARVDVRDALSSNSRGATASGRALRGMLVASEVAFAVALLVVMALLAKSFSNVQAIDPGFDPRNVLAARITVPPQRFNSVEAIAAFQQSLGDRVSALPGVQAQGAITLPPLVGALARIPFSVEGKATEPENVPMAQFRFVSAGYFDAVRIPLRRGRAFSAFDGSHTRRVAIVNQALVDRWFDAGDPIGMRLLIDDADDAPPRPIEIVGVVGNVQQISLDAAQPTWDIYLPYPQIHPDTIGVATANMFWFVRTQADPMSLAQPFATEVRRVNADVVASQLRPMTDSLADSVAPRRFSVSLMVTFAAAALLLAFTGIYAVVAYSVAQRAREFDIRTALGARASALVWLVIADGAHYIAAGVGAGLVMAFGAMRTLEATLFGLSPNDPATLTQVSAAVIVGVFAAAAIPALRAIRTGPLNIHTE